nr:type II toxin-antitoxin system VapC family toxin [uncultured Rhodopila sp.]
MIGWLLDTNVTAEIIRAGGSARVKAWAAARDEATLYLSILTIAEYDKGIANLPDGDPRRPVYMATRDRLAARFAARMPPVSDAIVRRWGTVRRDTGHPPPVIDTLLAAIAPEHDLYLATRNVRDVWHSGAAVFNPWEDDPSAFPVIAGQRRRRSPRA